MNAAAAVVSAARRVVGGDTSSASTRSRSTARRAAVTTTGRDARERRECGVAREVPCGARIAAVPRATDVMMMLF